MTRTIYSYVDVKISDIEHTDFELLTSKVDYYNQHDRILYFDSVLSEGELRFIHIFRYDDKDGYFPALLEVTEIFDDEVKTTMIKASEMTPEGLRSLAIAKRLMFLDNCYGEKRSVWSIAEKSRVLQDIDNLVGFSEFKNFVKNLCQYIINTKRLGSKANYNVVLINNCGMDEEIFVDSLYRLYSAEGIIKDAAIITGDLDDALRTERNTPCMYNIAERWDVGGNNGSFFTVTNEAAAFTKLSKRHPIYITSMDKAQFEKAQKIRRPANSIISKSVKLAETLKAVQHFPL